MGSVIDKYAGSPGAELLLQSTDSMKFDSCNLTLAPAALSEKVTNGDMEDDCCWTRFGDSGVVGQDSLHSHSPTHSWKIQLGVQSDDVGIYQGMNNLTVGKKYLVSAWIHPGTLVSGEIWLCLRTGIVYASYNVGSWVELRGAVVATQSVDSVIVYVYNPNKDNAGKEFYVDDISVQEINDGDMTLSGKLGIGVFSPQNKLDVDGDVNIASGKKYKIGGDDLSHTVLSNVGSNTHAQIDSHISNTNNPHLVTAAQAGAVSLSSDQTITGTKTFSSTIQGSVSGDANYSSSAGYAVSAGSAETATSATTASRVSQTAAFGNGLTPYPSQAYDGSTHVDVSVNVGAGLSISNGSVIASFAGSGEDDTISRSDHNHSGVYAPVGDDILSHSGNYNHAGYFIRVGGGGDIMDSDPDTVRSAIDAAPTTHTHPASQITNTTNITVITALNFNPGSLVLEYKTRTLTVINAGSESDWIEA